jgi:uncharacterized protein VirK/YbjX
MALILPHSFHAALCLDEMNMKSGSFGLEFMAISLLRAFSSKRIARLAYRYARLQYPEPNDLRFRLRFYLRSLFSLQSSATWFQLLDQLAPLRQCLKHEPEMSEKLHRPYRRTGFTSMERFQLVHNHIRVCEQLGWSELMASSYGKTYEIACFTDRNDHPLRLILARPGQFGKEGEIALHLMDGEVRLYSACFSFRVENGLQELDIGSIQGPSFADGRQRIRDLTRSLHGLRPRSLILEGLRAIASSTACSRLRVVGNSSHIYRSLRKRRSIAFDYDAFCMEVSGAIANGQDWLLPAQLEVRPLNEIPSKKRAEALRRRTLLEDLGNQIQARTALATEPNHVRINPARHQSNDLGDRNGYPVPRLSGSAVPG